jgi:hypothetical protein
MEIGDLKTDAPPIGDLQLWNQPDERKTSTRHCARKGIP